MIYFAKADILGHIKIGFTDDTDAEGRIRELQVGCPTRLSLMGTIPGGRETESDLHRRFAFAHLHGEWFRPVPELLAFIGQQTADERSGPADVETRYVSIKVLTVGKKSFTAAMFKQLPLESFIDWDASSPNRLVEKPGALWGRVLHGCSAREFWLVWQKGNELRRCYFAETVTTTRTKEARAEGKISWETHKKIEYKYSPVWEATRRKYLELDQLFIGV